MSRTREMLKVKIMLSVLLLFGLSCGCAHQTSPYVVGGVYSTGPVGGVPLYGMHKVIAAGSKQLLVHQSVETFSHRPTAVSQFPTNEAVIPSLQYFRIPVQDFERRNPVFIGTLPLTGEETEAASNK
jgi:hypothetical protein